MPFSMSTLGNFKKSYFLINYKGLELVVFRIYFLIMNILAPEEPFYDFPFLSYRGYIKPDIHTYRQIYNQEKIMGENDFSPRSRLISSLSF